MSEQQGPRTLVEAANWKPPVDANLSIAELGQVLDLMSKHGVTQIDYRGLKLARVPDKQVASTPEAQREFDRLAAMSSDKVDATFLKSRFGGT